MRVFRTSPSSSAIRTFLGVLAAAATILIGLSRPVWAQAAGELIQAPQPAVEAFGLAGVSEQPRKPAPMPYSLRFGMDLGQNVPLVVAPPVDRDLLLAEDAAAPRSGPVRCAVARPVSVRGANGR